MTTKMITFAMATEKFWHHHWRFIWKVSIFRKLADVISHRMFGPTGKRQRSATKQISTKIMQIILNHIQKVPKTMVYDWGILTYQRILSYIHHARKIFLSTGHYNWNKYKYCNRKLLTSLTKKHVKHFSNLNSHFFYLC